MSDKATILEINSYEQHTKNEVIAFSKPYFNGIFVMSCEYASLLKRPPYYGDTMTMRAWDFLKIPMGAMGTLPLHTWQNGYKYVYNYTSKTFDVYDDSGNNIDHRDNVLTIGDMHIDFTIYRSHEFIIYYDVTGENSDFFLIGKTVKKKYGDSPTYNYGSFKDYLYSDIKYPETEYVDRISACDIDDYVRINIAPDRKSYKLVPKPLGVDITKYNVTHSPKVYNSSYELTDVKFIKPEYKATFIKYSLLFALMSRCVYPSLYGLERADETHNNRPVYEPWLIWGVFKFLFLHREEASSDSYEIEVFDLSPNWAY